MAKTRGLNAYGLVSRKRSESASLSSWGSETNALSDIEESVQINSKRKCKSKAGLLDADNDFEMKMCSSSDDETTHRSVSRSQSSGKRPKCFSRNAVMARQNRLKKKKYLEDLEVQIEALRHENGKLKTALEGYSKDFQVVRKENLYLRNVLANSKEISQLIRAVNASTGLPTSSSITRGGFQQSNSSLVSKVMMDSVSPNRLTNNCTASNLSADDAGAPTVRNVRKDFPIAFHDVPLSSATEDNDELDMLFSCKTSSSEFDFNDTLFDNVDDMGFGPNALGDWLDGDEALSDIGVCLHVAKKKVSLEFCSSCNENAFSSLDEGISV